MTKRNYEELISDLAEEDRKAVEEKIQMLHGAMHICEMYLQAYAAGKTTAFKFLSATGGVCKVIAEIREHSVAKHTLPCWPPRRS